MRFPHSEIWSLSPHQLAEKCQEAAYSAKSKDAKLREEARHLYTHWAHAFNIDPNDPALVAQQAAHMAALRRRSIQVLLKLGM